MKNPRPFAIDDEHELTYDHSRTHAWVNKDQRCVARFSPSLLEITPEDPKGYRYENVQEGGDPWKRFVEMVQEHLKLKLPDALPR